MHVSKYPQQKILTLLSTNYPIPKARRHDAVIILNAFLWITCISFCSLILFFNNLFIVFAGIISTTKKRAFSTNNIINLIEKRVHSRENTLNR